MRMSSRLPLTRPKGRVAISLVLAALCVVTVSASAEGQTRGETRVSMTLRPQRGDVPIDGEPIVVEGVVSRADGTDAEMDGVVRLGVGEIDGTGAPSAEIAPDGSFVLPAFELPAIPEGADGWEISVAYEGGRGLSPSTSPASMVEVDESDPAITLTSRANPSPFGEPVTFRADVARVRDGEVPDGSVLFTVDGVTGPQLPLDSEGAAEWSAALGIGRHVVSVDYAPSRDDVTTAHAEVEQLVSPPDGKVDGGLTLLPEQLSRSPVAYRFTGRLVLPDGYAAERGCSGSVEVRMTQGRKSVSESAPLDKGCGYALKATWASRRLDPDGVITVRAAFSGNHSVRRTATARGFTLIPFNHRPLPGVHRRWIVSLGESYVSGEGGRWAGNSNTSPSSVDALGPHAYDDNATNSLSNPPGAPTPGTFELIPGCHRSHAARVFIRGLSGLNLACSGARTDSHFAFPPVNPGFKPGIDFFMSSLNGGQAAKLSTFAGSHRVRLVVIGIGGNDFGFGSMVSACLKAYLTSRNDAGFHTSKKLVYTGSYGKLDPRRYADLDNWHWITVQGAAYDNRKYCSEDSSITSLVSPGHAASVRAKVKTAILNAATALAAKGYQRKDYSILVQTVPDPIAGSAQMRYSQGAAFKPLDPSTWWDKPRQMIGGCGLWNKDLDWVHNVVIPVLNSTFKQAANDAAAATVGFPAYHPRVAVLDVENAFAGRRLCEIGTGLLPSGSVTSWTSPGAVDVSEWVTQIRTLSVLGSPYQLQEGIHPGYWGHLALRACVRKASPKALLNPPKSSTCTRGPAGLDATKNPPEPKMILN